MAGSPPALPVPAPRVQPELAGFWKALRSDRLLLPRCDRCDFLVWPPRPYCPNCSSLEVSWEPASGRGVVYSYTVNRRGRGYNRMYRDDSPYVIAYVELAEGPRVLSNVVGCQPGDVHIGMPVAAVFEHDGEDVIMRFRPATPSRSPDAEGA